MKYDVIIVGCGVAGMTAAIYLKRSGLTCAILESTMPGGQIVDNGAIENYPGFLKIKGSDLALDILNQVKKLEIPIFYESVLEISLDNEVKNVKTKTKNYQSSYIIIATGRKPKHLNLRSEDHFRNRGISYCAICDGNLYKDGNVVVIGGGNSAFEGALYLSSLVKKVTILSRRNVYKADKYLIEKAKEKENISFKAGEVSEFLGDTYLSKIKLKTEETMNVNGAFIYIGQIPNTDFLNSLSITDKNGYILVNSQFETKIKGIYAIGDCILKKHYQIVIAMGEAASCALNIREDFHE